MRNSDQLEAAVTMMGGGSLIRFFFLFFFLENRTWTRRKMIIYFFPSPPFPLFGDAAFMLWESPTSVTTVLKLALFFGWLGESLPAQVDTSAKGRREGNCFGNSSIRPLSPPSDGERGGEGIFFHPRGKAAAARQRNEMPPQWSGEKRRAVNASHSFGGGAEGKSKSPFLMMSTGRAGRWR